MFLHSCVRGSSRAALSGVLVLLAAVSAHAVSQPAVADHLRSWQRAQSALEEGRNAEALEALEEAHQLAPDEPLYTYHLGHLQERLGFNALALESLRSVLGHPGLDAELRELAATRVAALEPLADKAVLRLRSVPRDERVQIDGLALWETRPDVPLSPGVHLVCIVSPSSDRVRCWHADLPAGQRVEWPPPGLSASRAELRWPRDRAASRLYLEDYPLAVDLSRLEAIEVDAGTVRGAVGYAVGEDRFVLALAEAQVEEIPTRENARAAAEVRGRDLAGSSIYSRAPERSKKVGPAPWIVAGTGVAAAVVGAVFMAAGSAERSAITSARSTPSDGGLPRSSLSYAEASTRWDDANGRTRLGAALVGAGSALAVGGVVWWVIAKTTRKAEPAEGAAVWAEPGSAGLTWRGSF
jgi:tetratricopeptide (TPR) repeat protein